MHASCDYGDCYGALLHDMTSFEIVRETLCEHCPDSNQESTKQNILHVEPAYSDVEASIGVALQVARLDDFECEACGGKGARQQTRLGELPLCLITHSNKYAASSGPSLGAIVRVAGSDMQRVAVTHHIGDAADSGHYTATVATEKGEVYDCNDSIICRRSELCDRLWHNSYLSFLHKPDACQSASQGVLIP